MPMTVELGYYGPKKSSRKIDFFKNERRFFDSELFNYLEEGVSNEMPSGPKETLSFPGW
jgi:hypothetical protein